MVLGEKNQDFMLMSMLQPNIGCGRDNQNIAERCADGCADGYQEGCRGVLDLLHMRQQVNLFHYFSEVNSLTEKPCTIKYELWRNFDVFN